MDIPVFFQVECFSKITCLGWQIEPSTIRLQEVTYLLQIYDNFEYILQEYQYITSSNTGKYGPEITPYVDTFRAVQGKEFSNLS